MLTLEEILITAHHKIPERGRDLFLSGGVLSGTRDATGFTARVQGSSSHPYRVQVNLGREAWTCTCPYEHGAVCKHVYAAVLAALEAPEVFTEAVARDDTAFKAAIEAIIRLEADDVYALLEALDELQPEIVAEFAANVERRDRDW
ncbi:MAG: hypothetical protein HC933_16830 [Pleurocapsa sp. SU_196_0]|nr:hypothetical protein [Pleurocapsa sp. SU_196_0]